MTAREKIDTLRNKMRERGIDIYIVPTADYHASEYVGDYFAARRFLTGFTGSAGTAVVTLIEAALWTDGRYYIQAERQLEDSGISLMRMGEPGVPTVKEFVEEKLPMGGVIGFDGRTVSASDGAGYEKIALSRAGRLSIDADLVGEIWTDRPGLNEDKLWILGDELSGENITHKLLRIRDGMRELDADYHLVSSLYDIAWILNLRGNDISHVPVFLSYLLIDREKAALFIRDEVLTDEVRKYLGDAGVSIRGYDEIYDALADLGGGEGSKVLLDATIVNLRLRNALKESVDIINRPDISYFMKSVKNKTEIAHTKKAHIMDGVAVTRFMYWLKTHVGKEEITEYSAAKYLDELRRGTEGFIDLSFDSISAYGPNAAMMHYSAPAEGSAELKPRGLYLNDSGGHYLTGTTDITRTIVLGELTPMEKKHFTAVLKAGLNLASARFLYGVSGLNLDILCRGVLWQLHIDYRCGTGHGVGHILNVHEGPNGFRWKVVPERIDSGILEPGMITSDEPGVYIEGEYGIRTENELLCVEDETNEYGRFLKFEMLTFVPIDLDGIDMDEMDRTDIDRLNAYHREVFKRISPYLCEEEVRWLKEYTRPI